MRLLLLEEGHCFRDQALSFCNIESTRPREVHGGQLAVDAGADGQRRHRRHPDPGNGRAGGDALGVGVSISRFHSPAALANHRHDLAQFNVLWPPSSLQISEVVRRSADAVREQYAVRS